MKNPKYEEAQIAVNLVAFKIMDRRFCVFLEEREKEPFAGKLELPGGLLLANESAEETIIRKTPKIISHDRIELYQFFTFTSPQRDPRKRTVSIAYLVLLPTEQAEDREKWFPVNKVSKLAFDHQLIINKAKNHLISFTDIELLKCVSEQKFTLNELHEQIEILRGETYDNRNFRRDLITCGELKELNETRRTGSHRPAKLYSFTD
jgi:8-oxo-dGTP diphosphatase